MQLSNDRQVNEKSFKIGMNSQNFARFDPLSWEKIAYLNNILLKYCEAALSDRGGNVSQLRTRVENAISSLLPHGRGG
jgi:hypothetical protein